MDTSWIRISLVCSLLILLSPAALAYEECNREEVLLCYQELAALVEWKLPDEEACEHLRSVHRCLQNKADVCRNREDIERIASDLRPLKNVLTTHCVTDEEAEACLTREQDYIKGCVTEKTQEIIELIPEDQKNDEQKLKCMVMRGIGDCMVVRTEEKCGKKLAIKFMTHFLPELAKQNCRPVLATASRYIEYMDVDK